MTAFRRNKISGSRENVSEILKNARQEAGIDLTQAVKDTGINRKYLEAIEAGELERLPEGLYQEKYLKEYAGYLGLDFSWLMEAAGRRSVKSQGKIFVARAHKAHQFISLPKIVKNIVIAALVAGILLYLGFYLNNIIKEPVLEVLVPAADSTLEAYSLEVRGRTEREAEITINGEIVLTDKDGNFKKLVNFKNGVNTITVTAKKKYSRTNTVVRKVIVE